MERLLHYVWKYKLYAGVDLYTTELLPVIVLDPGIHNQDAGPDFLNAKVLIGDTTWVGNVEIHTQSSAWYQHGHHQDKNYDNVILHVVAEYDRPVYRMNGLFIPHLILPVLEHISRNIEWLLGRDVQIPCLPGLREIDPIFQSLWLDALVNERLERKTGDVLRLLDQYQEDWNEVFYITLTCNFGFGINSDAFEWLARHLPYRFLLKQRGSSSQVESMLLGQAGLLEEEHDGEYYRLLQKEYQFLKYKFGLKANGNYFFRAFRTRPGNFPHVKLAQLAAILTQHDTLFSVILNTPDADQLKKYFRIPPSIYWETHYHFASTSVKKVKILGEDAIRLILINTVVPILFAYGSHTRQPEYNERAIRLLEMLPAEKNHIVTTFTNAGLIPRHAADSQGLIQLKREYCEKKKCLFCQIGFRLLKRSTPL